MVKNGKKTEAGEKKAVKRILITQPKPESIKSPYFELAAKHNVEMEFMPFIQLEAIPSKDFRKQKIDIAGYSAVILTSKNAIDHFFRICEEMKVVVSPDTKYFCISESVAFIYRSLSCIENARFSSAQTEPTKGFLKPSTSTRRMKNSFIPAPKTSRTMKLLVG